MIKDAIANIKKWPAPETVQAVSDATEIPSRSFTHLGASVCFRCTAPLFGQKRGEGETESVPIRLHNHGKDAPGKNGSQRRSKPALSRKHCRILQSPVWLVLFRLNTVP